MKTELHWLIYKNKPHKWTVLSLQLYIFMETIAINGTERGNITITVFCQYHLIK